MMTQQTPRTIDEAEAKLIQGNAILKAIITMHCIPIRYEGALEFCGSLFSEALTEVKKLKANQQITLSLDDTHSIVEKSSEEL